MTATQIECFEAVRDTLSISKAAATLYVSQSAISKTISNLEKELGYPLFEREKNALTLTRAGEMFQEYLVRSKKEYSVFLDQLDQMNAESAQTVRLGCPEIWNPARFIDRLETCYAKAVPEGHLSIEAYKLSDLLLRLKNGKLDFVISHDFYSPNMTGLRSEKVAETGMGILYSRQFFPDSVSIKDLAKKEFLVFDDDIKKRFGLIIQSICKNNGYEAKIRNGGPVTKCLFELSRGSGVMLFTDWDIFISNQAYGFCPMEGKLPVMLTYYPDRLNSSGRAFIKEITSQVK